mgnify:CR=1 FL=1
MYILYVVNADKIEPWEGYMLKWMYIYWMYELYIIFNSYNTLYGKEEAVFGHLRQPFKGGTCHMYVLL